MRRWAALLAFLLAASPVIAQPALTYDELRSLPEDALKRRLFGALAPDFVLSHRPQEPARILRRASVWAWTRPRGAMQPGVCETDRAILYFQPVLPSPGRENPALRLAGIRTQTYYIIHDADLAEGRRRGDPEHPHAWADGCETRDPRRDAVPADHAGQLVHARKLIGELGTAARAGRSPVPLDCSLMYPHGTPPADQVACLREMSWLRPDLIGWVSGCRGAPAAANCIRVLILGFWIEFSLNAGQQAIAIRIEGVEDNSAVE